MFGEARRAQRAGVLRILAIDATPTRRLAACSPSPSRSNCFGGPLMSDYISYPWGVDYGSIRPVFWTIESINPPHG